MTQNVILLTVDSLRADYCGFIDVGAETTPKFDEQVDESVVFESAISPGTGTAYSMPVAFTGINTIHKVESFESHREWLRWHMEQFRTLPEWFSERGYETIGFTPNPYTSRSFGFNHGFDYFEDFLGSDRSFDLRGAISSRWAAGKSVDIFRLGLNMVGLGDISMSWEQYYEDILKKVRQATEPFFLWIFLLEPHWPYRPPSRYRQSSKIGMYRHNWYRSNASATKPDTDSTEVLQSLYQGTIRHVDEFIERLTNDLSEFDPAYVMHGDHGEAFGEHGQFGHGPHVYKENIHVPLVVWNTGESGRVKSPVTLAILPRILSKIVTDHSLLDFQHRSQTARSTAVDSSGEPTITEEALRWECIKLRQTKDGTYVYLLEDDPNEQTPKLIRSNNSEIGRLFDGLATSERQLIISNANIHK